MILNVYFPFDSSLTESVLVSRPTMVWNRPMTTDHATAHPFNALWTGMHLAFGRPKSSMSADGPG